MYAWFWNENTYAHEYAFEGYTAFVAMEGETWAYDIFLGPRWVSHDCGYLTPETAMVNAGNAIWNDYSGSVAILDFCGA